MPLYRVTVTQETEKVIDASNEWMASIIAADGNGAQIREVRPLRGRVPAGVHIIRADGRRGPGRPPGRANDASMSNNSSGSTATRSTKTTAKKRKKRAPLSPEARAKLAQNLAKARAAKAKKQAAAKKAARQAAKK